MIEPIYLHDWSSFNDMVFDFEDIGMNDAEYRANASPYTDKNYWEKKKLKAGQALRDEKYKGVKVLLASYTYESYEGDAFVLFRRKGELFEVNGGHCSCNGLEGQWEPKPATKKELLHRLDNGSLGRKEWNDYANVFAAELRGVLARIR